MRNCLAAVLLLAGPSNAQTPVEPGNQPAFEILDYQIDGNSVLDDESMEKAVYPFLGPDKSVDDVEKARAALEAAYRQAGYASVLVAIPEQDVKEGRVRLEVVEGSIETQYISGSRYHALSKIRAGLPALAEGQVPHMPSVQQQMAELAKQTPDRSLTPIFRAGSTPGKMEVELRVKDELPLHGSLEMNSRNTGNTSYSRMIGSLRYDNLWQRFHSLAVQYQLSPQAPSEVEVLTGTYAMPTGWHDTRLSLYGIGIHSNTLVPGIQVGDLAVIGSGSIFGVRLLKPLPGVGDLNHSVSLGFDYKQFGTTTTTSSAIDYAKFVLGYDAGIRSEQAATSLSLAANLSFQGLGNDPAQFAAKRTNAAGEGASPDFMYLTGNFKHQQALPWDLQWHGRIQGQASSTFLINNEQFSAGGPLSVRGYHQSQVLGDNGVNLSMELHGPKLLPAEWESVQNFRALAFADWASVWSSNQPPSPRHNDLASAGLGLRLRMFRHLSGEFDWAYPFNTYNSLTASVHSGQQRVDFRMLYEF